MSIERRLRLFLFLPLLCAAGVFAQQQSPPSQPRGSSIVLDVVVAPKYGKPVSGLQQQDFTLLDNKAPQTLTSFRAVDGRQSSIDVVILIDAVNAAYTNVAFERTEIDKYLRAEGGNLAHPTALAILTDKGTEMQPNFTSDGNALSASLDQSVVSLRTINRSAGFWGASERFQLSLDGLRQLMVQLAPHPERKIVLFISPGWPLLSGPRVSIDDKGQQQLFSDIVGFSTQLMQNRITLYSIDPLGTADVGTRTVYWKEFLKGVSKPSQVNPGNLALEVLATQSGGVALNANNDITAQLQQALGDLGTYYELSYEPPSDNSPHEYHQIEVKISKPGLIARTRQGYYSQP